MNLFDVYPLFDIEITRGKGCHVYDAAGTEYLDLYGGHAVVSVGHCHPMVVKAIEHQASQLMFYSNSVINPLQKQLAEKLGRVSGYDDYSLFLVNSGAPKSDSGDSPASTSKRVRSGSRSGSVNFYPNPSFYAFFIMA